MPKEAALPDLSWLREPRPAWYGQASCAGLPADVFHPEGKNREAQAVREHALRICADCPVRTDCAAHALDLGRVALGVWGGLTQAARRPYRQRQALEATHG